MDTKEGHLEIINASKIYDPEGGNVLAVDNCSFEIQAGEFVAIVGPSGCGKTTLLNMTAGFEDISKGEIRMDGQVIAAPGRAPRQEVTLLLQEPYLLKTSVFENVVYGLRVRGRRHDLREAAEAAMLAVGFAPEREMLRRPWKALSGGEKQRVALAETQLKLAKTRFDTAELQYKEARISFNEGTEQLPVVADRQEAMVNARIAYIDAELEYKLANLEWMYVANLLQERFLGLPAKEFI